MNRIRQLIVAASCVAVSVTLAASAPPRSLTVLGAASQTKALDEIADTLRRRLPDLHVEINYAGSQSLALQVQQGAVADVFASADDHWMSVVHDSGFVSGEPRVFVHNQLVVIVPKRNPGHLASLHDLARPGIKLVLADEAVPAGHHYARTAIANLGRLSGFAPGYLQQTSCATSCRTRTM